MAENKERKGRDLNSFVFTGRITMDPEIKTLDNEKGTEVCNFAVANQTYGAKQVSFFNCQAFNHTAKFIHDYLKKGNQVTVEGELSIRPYEDKEGNKRVYPEIKVNYISSALPTQSITEKTTEEMLGDEIDDDDDLPF